MVNNYLFSIIVPVYNVQEYLIECVNSVLIQNFNSYEILLIDDGSTDESGQMCDALALKAKNVKTFHQINGGLSAARNTGLRNATGKYIVFLDSDDLLENHTLEHLSEIIKSDKDIYVGYGLNLLENGEFQKQFERRRIGMNELSGIDFFNKALSMHLIGAPVPYNIYKRSFLVDNNLWFKEGILHEDELWTPITFSKAKSVEDFPYDFYYYRAREGSITRSSGSKSNNGKHLINNSYELSDYFKQFPKNNTRFIFDNISALFMSGVYLGQLAEWEAVNRFFPLKNAKTAKNVLKAMLFALSPSLYCKVHKIVKH